MFLMKSSATYRTLSASLATSLLTHVSALVAVLSRWSSPADSWKKLRLLKVSTSGPTRHLQALLRLFQGLWRRIAVPMSYAFLQSSVRDTRPKTAQVSCGVSMETPDKSKI